MRGDKLNALDVLIREARNTAQLRAHDVPSGVQVEVKRGALGWRVECYLNGERRHYNTCLKALEARP